jgi:hypothetical protein
MRKGSQRLSGCMLFISLLQGTAGLGVTSIQVEEFKSTPRFVGPGNTAGCEIGREQVQSNHISPCRAHLSNSVGNKVFSWFRRILGLTCIYSLPPVPAISLFFVGFGPFVSHFVLGSLLAGSHGGHSARFLPMLCSVLFCGVTVLQC